MPLDVPEIPAKSLILEVNTPGSNAVQVIGGCLSEMSPPALPYPPDLPPPDQKPQQPKPDCKPKVIGAPMRVLLSRFWFRDDGSLRDFDAEGPALEQIPSYRAFIEFLHANQDATNAEAAVGLEKAEAKYPPKNKTNFRNGLPLPLLQRFLGNLRVVSVEFSPPSDDSRFTGTPVWTVLATHESENGPSITYEMRFEPFGGLLIWLRDKSIRRSPYNSEVGKFGENSGREIRGQERVKKWTGGPDYFCFFSPSDDRPASINRSATTTHNQHGGCPHLSAPLYFP